MSKYGNVEISDPQFELTNLRQLTFKSPALKSRGDVTIFVPPGCDEVKSLPLVLLLHGVYGSHWCWTMKGGAHLTVLDLIKAKAIDPMVLVMPSDGLWGDGSGYLKHEEVDHESWIMDDVIGCVTEQIPCLDSRSPVFIGGLSMGGYGALRLGAKYADRVAGFSAHSSITRPEQLDRFVEGPFPTYAEALQQKDSMPLYWMEKHKALLPPFRFDCGVSDSLIEENRELHESLTRLGIPHDYHEFAGGHDWSYWREHLSDTLFFFSRVIQKR